MCSSSLRAAMAVVGIMQERRASSFVLLNLSVSQDALGRNNESKMFFFFFVRVTIYAVSPLRRAIRCHAMDLVEHLSLSSISSCPSMRNFLGLYGQTAGQAPSMCDLVQWLLAQNDHNLQQVFDEFSNLQPTVMERIKSTAEKQAWAQECSGMGTCLQVADCHTLWNPHAVTVLFYFVLFLVSAKQERLYLTI